MRFNDIVYERIDYEKTKNRFEDLVRDMNLCKSFSDFREKILDINKIRSHIKTMSTYATLRFSTNINDEFYKKEKEYWDVNMPLFESLDSIYYDAVINNDFKDEIIDTFGKQYYEFVKTFPKCFSNDIIPYLQEENRLMSEYTTLLASCRYNLGNKVYNLSSLMGNFGSLDTKERLESIRLHTKYFEDNEEKFDEIFDRLVEVRDKMSKLMGYNNFIELGYYRMHRTDYNEEMVDNLRVNVMNKYLSKAIKSYENQAKRIGVKTIDYFSENLLFSDCNPKPIGSGEEIINLGIKMYDEMSEETSEFIHYLVDNGLFDVYEKENKAMGGYCTILYDYNDPFIFGNFNGSLDDVDVLTHEAGHAFQVYMSKGEKIPELVFPTLDSCEIFSMSMEFFTYPWMKLFFKDDFEKYTIYHEESFLKFIPYGCLVDHFQHKIYRNPNMSKDDRKKLWRKLEKKYTPFRIYKCLEIPFDSNCKVDKDELTESLSILEKGCYWYRQGHIFKNPFYYIDYVLAEICALQFKEEMDKDWNNAWNKYVKISKLGGKYSFLELLEKAGLQNPFK